MKNCVHRNSYCLSYEQTRRKECLPSAREKKEKESFLARVQSDPSPEFQRQIFIRSEDKTMELPEGWAQEFLRALIVHYGHSGVAHICLFFIS